MKRVLVLCEGNICRSPMAEGLFKAALPAITFRSAGLGAMLGRPADPICIDLMAQKGIDISAHRGAQVTRLDCVQSDLILVMDGLQKQRLAAMYPEVRGRVFRIGERIDEDVEDPYRQGEAVFRAVLEKLERGVDAWGHVLRQC